MEDTRIQVSVVIPVYNCAPHLKDTVLGILDTELCDFELILVDDGSTDGSSELCDALCKQYCQLCCIHQPNAGVSSARNRGIDAARGGLYLVCGRG